ncbi:MAG: hypothetical protein WDM89_06060 [Rhizomicrobium sp.]
MQEIAAGKMKDADEIAVREGRSKRSVHMLMSLAFLAPDIVEAAVSGQLPSAHRHHAPDRPAAELA